MGLIRLFERDYAVICNALIDRMYDATSENRDTYQRIVETILPELKRIGNEYYEDLEVKLVLAQANVEFNPQEVADTEE